MQKQLISFAQVIKFLENMNIKGGVTPTLPFAYALGYGCSAQALTAVATLPISVA